LQQYGPLAVAGLTAVTSGNPYAPGMAYGLTQAALAPLTKDPYKQQQQVAQGTQAAFGSYPYYQHYGQKNPSLPSAPGQQSEWSKWWGSWQPGLPPPQQAAQPSSHFSSFSPGALGQPLSLYGPGGIPPYQPTQFNLNPQG
jgi:hypothetical protein